ncbi:MAG: heavy metal translocating P-type ATPase [Sphaerochaetaceae bacterium]|jgi:Cd2+/Zn2+-exporting ATPase|nr:heavy metal translocating P-type ATPase [Sphaerochaetaceae bacterium]
MTKKQLILLIRIAASSVLLLASWAFKLQGPLGLAAYLAAYAIAGWNVVWGALLNIFHGQVFDEKFLMTVATAGAMGLGDYKEAVAVMVFYQIGEWFESIALGKSRKSIASLMDIRPDEAVVLRDGQERAVDPSQVEVGETLIVKPGEKIPLDGVIIEGSTSVNTAALTGESLPLDRGPSDRVVSGSINLTSVIRMRAETNFAQSTVSRILELTENAAQRKARIEGFITRFSRWYTPIVVLAAVLLATIAPLFFAQSWGKWINRALIFLVVSCPCALVVSVPLSFFGGIGGASHKGILIKGAGYLELLSRIKTAVFDKTGTLTKGVFEVVAIHPQARSEAELLDLAALAEANSSHPIAQSILRAHEGHIDKSRISSVKEMAGQGVEAIVDGRRLYVGNSRLMESVGASWRPCHHEGTVIHVSEGKEYLGHIVISDTIKQEAREAIAQLKSLGVERTVMLTGDSDEVGQSVGKAIGIDIVASRLMPQDKVSRIESLISKDAPLCFVGDGINDAPVLSRADVGIAMGDLGSDAAIEAADVVLMDDNLMKLPQAIRLARKTMRIVRQNIVFALSVKALVLVLGSLGFATMWLAVFADVGVLVLAILNAMRALR